MEEFWKDINEHKGVYQISNLGKVRSLDRMVFNQYNSFFKKGKILSPYKTGRGYLSVELFNKQYKVHRLVAGEFIPNPNNNPEVNHINGIKTDNVSSNLEWVTSKENTQHALKNGLRFNNVKGEDSHLSKLTEKDILKIRNESMSNTHLSKIYGVHPQTILRIKNRKTWKHI